MGGEKKKVDEEGSKKPAKTVSGENTFRKDIPGMILLIVLYSFQVSCFLLS
jgi:hypothetical protein